MVTVPHAVSYPVCRQPPPLPLQGGWSFMSVLPLQHTQYRCALAPLLGVVCPAPSLFAAIKFSVLVCAVTLLCSQLRSNCLYQFGRFGSPPCTLLHRRLRPSSDHGSAAYPVSARQSQFLRGGLGSPYISLWHLRVSRAMGALPPPPQQLVN